MTIGIRRGMLAGLGLDRLSAKNHVFSEQNFPANACELFLVGLEKLLMEAERRGLSETNEFDPNFNPINYLAQFLMRNNPRVRHQGDTSAYVTGLRDVTHRLHTQISQSK